MYIYVVTCFFNFFMLVTFLFALCISFPLYIQHFLSLLSPTGECFFYSIFYHCHSWKFQLISHSEEAIHFRKKSHFLTLIFNVFFFCPFLVHDNTNYMLPTGSQWNSSTFGAFNAWVAYTAHDPRHNESFDNVFRIWTTENNA